MVRDKLSVPRKAKKYAEDWAKMYLSGETVNGGAIAFKNTLEGFVHQYMDEIFKDLLDTIMGIDRRFSQVEMKSTSGGKTTIAEQLAEQAKDKLRGRFMELLGLKEFTLTPREIQIMRNQFRRRVLSKLDEEIDTVATKQARKIAKVTLNSMLDDEEWITLIDAKLKANKFEKKDEEGDDQE